MRPSDITVPDDVLSFFEQCLQEEGITDATVSHSTKTFSEVFYIRKEIGEEQLLYKTTFDLSHRKNRDEIIEITRKKIAREAKEVAKEFREKLVDVFEWSNRCVHVSIYNGGWAQCQSCKTRVDFNRRPSAVFSADAELSTPQPHPLDAERDLEQLSGHRENLIKLYLIGQLREQCDRNCPNNKYNWNNPPVVLRSTTGVNAN